METRHSVQLADGRSLSYAEYGNSDARPVFYFHGWPGSRYEGQMFAHPQIRLIAVERPGFGHSDFKPGRALLDWAQDMNEFAEILGIDRFGILGFSGGGPYALTCAYQIPKQIVATVVVNGLSPLTFPDALDGVSAQHRLAFLLARRAPWLLSFILKLNIDSMRKFASGAQSNGQPPIAMPERDRRVIQQDPVLRKLLLLDMIEAFKQGTRGPVWEQRLYARHWGFELSAVNAQVHLWQGMEDINVSPAMGHYLANTLPNCDAHFCEGEGHITLVQNHLEEILSPFFIECED